MTTRKPITADMPRVAWEKRRGESAPAFHAFALYRDLGPQRSIQKVATELSKSMPLLKGWSKKHDWVDRADKYDVYADNRRREMTEENWRIANHRHQVIAGTITSGLMRRLQGDTRKGREVPALDPKDIAWGDVRGLARDAVAIERLVHGQPTDFALRATAMTVESALGHVTTLIEIARKIMDSDQFQAFVVEYAAATAQATGDMPRPREEITA